VFAFAQAGQLGSFRDSWAVPSFHPPKNLPKWFPTGVHDASRMRGKDSNPLHYPLQCQLEGRRSQV
jgi:hypothetical protein